MPDTPSDPKPATAQLVTDDDLSVDEPHIDSDADVVAAPTEPALGGLTPGAPLSIKRATLMQATDSGQDEAPSSQKLRNIESYVGFIVDGRYHIESVIAQGGMGVVYYARHRLIDKPVALKILRPELVHNREITARFLIEAQAASAIGNEHIVDVTDYGELPDGATYIVMEYLDGYSLNQRIRRSAGLLPVPTVLGIAREIAEGLQRAHDANIIHRDLKPDNILLVSKGKREDFVKILDFGIAKVQSSQNQTTTAGRIFGTPHYMSPEQGRGDDLDHRTDIYSLGVILYEMLTGHVPFDGENPLGILTQHLYVEVKSLSSQCAPERITPALECVVARCLMKKPEHRYASMAELDEDLRRLQDAEPPLAWNYFKRSDVVPEYLRPILQLPSSRPKVSRPLLLVAATALVVAGAYVVAGPLSRTSNTAPVPSAEPAASGAPEEVTETPTKVVNLAAEPIDTHVFRGQTDLGQIPILVQLRPGQSERLVFRRPGYKPYHLVVDGSQERYAIRLERQGSSSPVGLGVESADLAPPAPTRIVDLRASKPQPGWSPIVSPAEDGGVPPYLEELFGNERDLGDSNSEPTIEAREVDVVLHPPEHMDPSAAPPPPGPPASGRAGESGAAGASTPALPGQRPTRPSSAHVAPWSPPGPPPVDD